MKKYNTANAFVIVLMVLVSFSSCKKTLDSPSKRLGAEDSQWQNISDTRAGLFGMYGLFRAALAENNAHWMYGELRKGDFVSYKRADYDAIIKGDLNSSHDIIQILANWRRLYAVVNAASLFIERAPEVAKVDPRYTEINLKSDVAQARVIRAFAYYYLVRVWGDVPLLTSSHDNGKFEEKPRSDKAIVLAFAEQEILNATEDLPYIYGVSPQTYYGLDQARLNGVLFNKNSAYVILSHIAALQGNYLGVDVYTQFVMDNYTKSSMIYLTINQLTGADQFFNSNGTSLRPSQIVAFNFADDHGESTRSGHIEELTLAAPLVLKQFPEIFVPRDTIINIFNDPQNRDSRFGIDTVANLPRTNYFTNFNSATPIFSKIKVIRGGAGDGTFSVFGSALVFSRLEEITLLRSEALAVLGRQADAVILLDAVRNRRSLPSYNVIDDGDLMDAIFSERRKELMGEGWRWFDLVRYNKIKQNDLEFKRLIDEGGIYWPIAEDVLQRNSQLEQNNYWK